MVSPDWIMLDHVSTPPPVSLISHKLPGFIGTDLALLGEHAPAVVQGWVFVVGASWESPEQDVQYGYAILLRQV